MEADVVPPGWLPAGGFTALEQRDRCRYRRIRPGPDATWQLLALANYQASEQVFVSLGYRHQPLDYRDKGKRLHVALSGPMLGLTWRLGLPAASHRP